ncbi:GAT-like domain-containing protein [Aspergillus homomorphus CBS 101889]|uniref:GAT-like domain-containing protein n=1 Tax=Aspergillus homomorphus (strain CBS 101889) TaxID=1450537 RepID=A0A395I9G8_ASPHC|nr:GAT-like domain-containing protein [Aspergillus homomorphus CBS 101889]RAL15708.1 GAT-like domain-containing protein [Aspergillus homomorphus CBS 101889]
MKRIFNSFSKRSSPTRDSPPSFPDDSPEGIILREVTAFCEEGANSVGNEYVHLPGIVENAESSPNAAREAALLIRNILSEPSKHPGHVQYNAIMLIRILVDNPGHTFSRNLDAKFVATVKDLLKQGRDHRVHSLLWETLDALEVQRSWDEDLTLLLQMWSREKGKSNGRPNGLSDRFQASRSSSQVRVPQASQNHFAPSRQRDTLPRPEELAERISEAKTSAKLLTQFVQSTPPTELLENELILEFSDRCRTASRVIQNYIHATNPAPDEDTLLTLIQTNDELTVALSNHQHALLRARRSMGQSGSPSPATSSSNEAAASGAVQMHAPPPVPPRQPQRTMFPSSASAPMMPGAAGPSGSNANNGGWHEQRSGNSNGEQDPFADRHTTTAGPSTYGEPRTDGPSSDWWTEAQQRPGQHS